MTTESKRRSIVGVYGLVTVPPVADAVSTASKRRHTANLYEMDSAAGRTSFWVPVTEGSQTWQQDSDASQTWVDDNSGSTDWTPVYKVNE